MNRRHAAQLLGSLSILAVAKPASLFAQGAGTVRGQAALHPRIAAAITAIQDAIAYMEQAPHDFGGHRVAAIEASRAALQQLRQALAYRAAQNR
jgi:hypothetical protein